MQKKRQRTFKELVNGVEWFNKTYFSENRAGQGFSLVAEGYINFGFLGIILVFVLVGLLIKFIYQRSSKNIYYFSFYVVSIPVFMYSIRADLTNILSPIIRQNLIVVILVLFITQIIRNHSSENIKPNQR